MGEKYWITGVQIGMLKALIKNRKTSEAFRTLKEVEDKQFIEELLTNFFDFVDKETKREGVTLEELERDALIERFLKEAER